MTEEIPLNFLPKEIREYISLGDIVSIKTEKRKYGKIVTLIFGISRNQKEITRKLKKQLGCGGTVKNGHIELQGNHVKRLKEILPKLGYKINNMEKSL